MWPKRLAPGAALVFECEEGGADGISRRRECESYAVEEEVVDDDEAAGLHDLWIAITPTRS
jgi:hypothetical protein